MYKLYIGRRHHLTPSEVDFQQRNTTLILWRNADCIIIMCRRSELNHAFSTARRWLSHKRTVVRPRTCNKHNRTISTLTTGQQPQYRRKSWHYFTWKWHRIYHLYIPHDDDIWRIEPWENPAKSPYYNNISLIYNPDVTYYYDGFHIGWFRSDHIHVRTSLTPTSRLCPPFNDNQFMNVSDWPTHRICIGIKRSSSSDIRRYHSVVIRNQKRLIGPNENHKTSCMKTMEQLYSQPYRRLHHQGYHEISDINNSNNKTDSGCRFFCSCFCRTATCVIPSKTGTVQIHHSPGLRRTPDHGQNPIHRCPSVKNGQRTDISVNQCFPNVDEQKANYASASGNDCLDVLKIATCVNFYRLIT